MNVNDTERMSVLLSDMGARPSASAADADIVILNGCEVRDKAVQKALSSLGLLKKDKKKSTLIGIGGCVGQLEGAKLFSRNPHLDFVFGTDTIDHLPEILGEVSGGARHVVYNDFDKGRDYTTDTKIFHKSASAFINIMKGCDKFCSYCIVPFTRGREKSRPVAEIVSDVTRLALLGVREVTLLGQNVNSFGKGNKETFPELLRALDEAVPSLKRLRYTSSHPVDFSDELIECYGSVRALCNQLHLPVQSGSNKVLQGMYRHYRIETYYEQIRKWRARCPDGGLSTDIIVGFPGETDTDFDETMKLLEDLRFDSVYSFAYSPRPGTKAFKLADDVPLEVKSERLQRFQKRGVEIAAENNARKVGKKMEVLVEGRSKIMKTSPSENMFYGRTTCGRVVNFP
ncbi:MAG: tRNA (N6-isopentenyl adenosine(37)-C2)-methylthiotransferase MiaB, partial [Deltaproteobacteria bacterium]|nr:tRNA (N6-isopentenyl adenosine(37)-C2)-methylthiotransferase MiaB [Deltaproteobacteria bacterium]